MTPCTLCARVQRTCCQRAEILVTEGDVARIRAHGVTMPFFEFRPPADTSAAEPDPADPAWAALTIRADGTRRVLRRRPDGDCTFLRPSGCALPGDVRPLVCRLYPFTYTEHALAGEAPDYCPTALLAPRGEPMAQILDMSRDSAESCRRQLYAELRAEQGAPLQAGAAGEAPR